MDSFFIKALGLELQAAITGARIGKPWLKDPFRIIFPLTISGHKAQLYCSCHPSLPILYLQQERSREKGSGHEGKQVEEQTELLIRKYLTGATITEVQIVEMERILILRLQADNRDFPPDYPVMDLIFEIMGRHANVILTSDQGKILVALRYVPAYKNQYRQILLGHTYRFPPKLKIDPLLLSEEAFFQLQDAYDGTTQDTYHGVASVRCSDFLHRKIAGLDPLLTREIAYRAESEVKTCGEKKALWEAFSEILEIYQQGAFSPRLIYLDDGSVLLFSLPLEHCAGRLLSDDQLFSSPSEAALFFEGLQQERRAVQGRREMLRQKIRSALSKVKARQFALERDWKKADSSEEYRQKGDLIMANLYSIKKGTERLETENFYQQPPLPIIITLDPHLTPAQNAQKYYKRYTKAKKSLDVIQPRLESAQKEASFLSSLLSKIEAEDRLAVLEGYINLLKEKGMFESKKGASSHRPGERSIFKDVRRYVSVDGLEILVGKNDRGNDTLTCKIAQKNDLWFHTQDVPGSHVLVRNPERLAQLPLSTIRQAASLAAYFSKARKDTKVAVDYTFRKYITKPKGAKPGLVLVTKKHSIRVAPSAVVAGPVE